MNPVKPNMPPDEKRAFERDLAAEQRLQGRQVPDDLAADWRLKQELAALDAPALPEALRRRVLARTTRARRPVRWLAAAAMLAGVTLLAVVLQPTRNEVSVQAPVAVSAEQIDQLRLALRVLGHSGERGLVLASEGISSSIAGVELHPGALPYIDRFGHFLRPVIRSGSSPKET